MKAFYVTSDQEAEEWGVYIHAQTPSKAKSLALTVWPDLFAPDYTSLRARRLPGLDDKPTDFFNLLEAGITFYEPEDILDFDVPIDCPCNICKPVEQIRRASKIDPSYQSDDACDVAEMLSMFPWLARSLAAARPQVDAAFGRCIPVYLRGLPGIKELYAEIRCSHIVPPDQAVEALARFDRQYWLAQPNEIKDKIIFILA